MWKATGHRRDAVRKIDRCLQPAYETNNLLFQIAVIRDAIPDSPNGVWMSNELAAKNPDLRTVELNDISYKFIAISPTWNVPQSAPIHLLHRITSKSAPGSSDHGNQVPVWIYAECDRSEIRSLVEESLEGADSPDLTNFAHELLLEGHRLAAEFVDILRQEFDQYWLQPPSDQFEWSQVQYYRPEDECWYAIDADSDFVSRLLHKPPPEAPDWGRALTRTIGQDDLRRLQEAEVMSPGSFAYEMLSEALVDLSMGRIRSSIVHSIIGYESATKTALKQLLDGPLKDLESGKVLECISKELSTLLLGRTVLEHAHRNVTTFGAINWQKISELYNTRNQIVHCGRRRMPKLNTVREQVLEVRSFIRQIEDAIDRRTKQHDGLT